MTRTYLHTGIPVHEKTEGMSYLESLRVWIGYNKDYDVEYLFWEKGTPMAWRGVAETHVAYKVASVKDAVAEAVRGGADVLLPELGLGGTKSIAYVSIQDGPVVEFVQD